MRLLIISVISVLTLAAAGRGDQDSAKAPPADDAAAKKAASKAAPAREAPKVEIPAGAVQSEDGAWHYTDDKGKKWVYRKTPFGIARAEDKPVQSPEEAMKRFENVKATEDGDSIRFERPGPFGTYKWQRKKTELNEMERAVWEREKSRTAKQD